VGGVSSGHVGDGLFGCVGVEETGDAAVEPAYINIRGAGGDGSCAEGDR